MRLRSCAALTLLLIIVLPAVAPSQTTSPSPRSAISLSYGLFQYDLSGTGDARILAVRAERPLATFALLEGGVAFARPAQQFGDTTTYVITEAQLQGQWPLGRVAPYLGGGIGLAMDFRQEIHGGMQTDVTLSAAGGLRAWITERLGARAELRLRGVGWRFTGSAAEWTLGAAWRL
jgi:hypothetical protein